MFSEQSGVTKQDSAPLQDTNYREAFLRHRLPRIDAQFEEVEAIFTGIPKAKPDNAFTCELVAGAEGREEYDKLTLCEVVGGTWRDYLEAEDTLERWLRKLSIGQSKHRVHIIDTLSPLAVLTAKNARINEDAYTIALTANTSSTPLERNTSYAALRTIHGWKTPTILATRTYVETLTAFDERFGLLRREQAFNRYMTDYIEAIDAIASFMKRDENLGVKTHVFTALTSANERVYRNIDSAINTQIQHTSTTLQDGNVLSMRLLGSSNWRRFTEIEQTFRRIQRKYPNLIDSEIRLMEKQTRNDLYDVHIFFGLKHDPILPILKEGYEAIAKRTNKLRLEANA